MRILLLEDDPDRIKKFSKIIEKLTKRIDIDFFYFEDAIDCINYLKSGQVFDLILLDHDLGGRTYVDVNEKNTGSEVVRWIINNYDLTIANTRIITHTLNDMAAIYMISLLPEI